MVDLVPVWVTPAQSIGTVVEGRAVAIDLVTYETVTFSGVATQFVVTVGVAVSRVTGLTIDGVETAFTVNAPEGTVLWTTPLTHVARIVVRFSPALTFTLLNGSLPPGATMSASGAIRGSLLHIPTAAAYAFTVRISNGARIRDRTFSLLATPQIEGADFYYPSIRPLAYDPAVGAAIKDLGPCSLDGTFAYGIDTIAPNGALPVVTVEPVYGLSGANHGGLPRGLALDGTTITGVIDAEACLGAYYFAIHILDPNVPTSLIFKITIVGDVSSSFGVEPGIVWSTPAGDIGSIPEKDPSYVFVKAVATGTDTPVTYSLAHSSSPLPSGLTLNATTGEISGTTPHVGLDTPFPFTIRATVGTIFSDRIFRITVKNRFSSDAVAQVLLRLRQGERTALLPAYDALIPDALVYRSNDPAFGRPVSATAYLIYGLDASVPFDTAISGSAHPAGKIGHSYQAPFRLLLGAHRFAVARDANGVVVYEVLLRDLIDPLSKAGGFLTTDLVSARPVAYPQSRDLDVFPNSLNNLRRDLVDAIGFAVSDATAKRTIGIAGPELMPLWMRSPQTAGDTATIPGFVPAIVLAYLAPGTGAAIRKLVNDNAASLPEPGLVYHFDQYYVDDPHLIGTTTFDGQGTTFDDGTMLLDVTLDEDDTVKYLNNSRA